MLRGHLVVCLLSLALGRALLYDVQKSLGECFRGDVGLYPSVHVGGILYTMNQFVGHKMHSQGRPVGVAISTGLEESGHVGVALFQSLLDLHWRRRTSSNDPVLLRFQSLHSHRRFLHRKRGLGRHGHFFCRLHYQMEIVQTGRHSVQLHPWYRL